MHRRVCSSAAARLRSVVSEAECRLQCPPAYPFVRNLLSQDLTGLAVSLKRMIGSRHPLVSAAQRLLGPSRAVQAHRMAVVLVARAAEFEADMSLGALEALRRKQYQVADICESIHTALSIHNRIVSPGPEKESRLAKELANGNQLATLSGDYLLASSSLGLAELDNTGVVSLISQAICDLVSSQFCPVVSQGEAEQPLELARAASESDWTEFARLQSSSLLSRSCLSVLLLAGLSEDSAAATAAVQFADSFGLMHHLHKENSKLVEGAAPGHACFGHFGHLRRGGGDFEEYINDGGLTEDTERFQRQRADACRKALAALPQSYCTDFLGQMVAALE